MEEIINIYTDGSSLGNPGPGGYGIILEWKKKNYIKEYSKGFKYTTNNRMELLAVVVALEKIKRYKEGMLKFSLIQNILLIRLNLKEYLNGKIIILKKSKILIYGFVF